MATRRNGSGDESDRRAAKKERRTTHRTGASDAQKNATMGHVMDHMNIGKKYDWLPKVRNIAYLQIHGAVILWWSLCNPLLKTASYALSICR
jgi:hypothetical protein